MLPSLKARILSSVSSRKVLPTCSVSFSRAWIRTVLARCSEVCLTSTVRFLPTRSVNRPGAMAVDGLGNVYVAGIVGAGAITGFDGTPLTAPGSSAFIWKIGCGWKP